MFAPNSTGRAPIMSPGDAQKMTSYLFGLGTPQAVQAAATKNQHDINFVALASSVAAAMKNVMAPQSAPPQGTVTQQAIQQMAPPQQAPQHMAPPQQAPQQLPETSGIGQLNPGQGVQSMAGGGITGEPRVQHFAEKGLVPGGGLTPYAPYVLGGAQERPDLSGAPAPVADAPVSGNSIRMPYYEAVDTPTLSYGESMSKIGNTLSNIPGWLTSQPGSGGPLDSASTPVTKTVTPAAATAAPAVPAGATFNLPLPLFGGDKKTVVPGAGAGAGPAGPGAGPAGAGAVTDAAGMKALYNQIEKLVGGKTYAQNQEDVELAQPWKGVEYLKTVGEHSQDLFASAKAMGIDPANTAGFARLEKLQTQADELLERKQNLAIIQGGLSMIRPGHWATAIAQGAGEGIGKYSAALDAHQASMGKLEDSRAMLDTAKNTMNMALYGKTLDRQENALKDYLADARSKGDRAATMTDAQALRVATLAAQVSQNQTTIQAAGIAAQAHKEMWADRNKAGLDRATLMAAAKNHPKYDAMFKSVAATMPGRTPDDIGLATTEQMMRAGMIGGGGIISGAPPQQ